MSNPTKEPHFTKWDEANERYRPLAEGERIEEGDECKSTENLPGVIYKWGMAYGHEGNRVGDIDGYTYRRPIPETNWREPVGEAGYPYPQGTVVRIEGGHDWIIADNRMVCRSVYGGSFLGRDTGRHKRHKVVDFDKAYSGDYRPDLVTQETPADETQADLSRTDETEELLPCPFCGGGAIKARDGWHDFNHKKDCWISMQPEDLVLSVSVDEVSAWNTRTESAELTRLRAEVERYKASAENLRDFADLFKQERDEARAEVERLKSELAKYQPAEYKLIDLTESTVFVGAACGEGEGEIQ